MSFYMPLAWLSLCLTHWAMTDGATSFARRRPGHLALNQTLTQRLTRPANVSHLMGHYACGVRWSNPDCGFFQSFESLDHFRSAFSEPQHWRGKRSAMVNNVTLSIYSKISSRIRYTVARIIKTLRPTLKTELTGFRQFIDFCAIEISRSRWRFIFIRSNLGSG